MSRTEYERLYFAQLALLDAGVVAEHLIALAGPAEPVLLCWEHKAGILNGTTWCHRHMVADWFQQTLGQTVEEL